MAVIRTSIEGPLPRVVVRTPDGERHTIYPGGLIGRLPSAALSIDNPYVSEAHCLVSLRGSGMNLLALRGGFKVGTGRKWLNQVRLEEGMVLVLAQSPPAPPVDGASPRRSQRIEDYALVVETVVVPERVLALAGIATEPVPLDRPEWSVDADPLRVTAGTNRDADAWLWRIQDGWSFQQGAAASVRVGPGDTLTVGTHRLALVLVEGRPQDWTGSAPMVVECWSEHTEIRVTGRELVRLQGNLHQLVRQTALLQRERGEPAHWSDVAAQIWRANPTEHNWTKNLRRLKDALNTSNLPQDLLSSDNGYVRLALRDVDRLILH